MAKYSKRKSSASPYLLMAVAVLVIGVFVTTYAAVKQTNTASQAFGGNWGNNQGNGAHVAHATLVNANGDKIGMVRLVDQKNGVRVQVDVAHLTPGYHGFHVHSVGQCVAPFTTAGGHYQVPGPSGVAVSPAVQPNHSGDLPSLLVNKDGTAHADFVTDRFTVADLFDTDGSAFIVHAGADNFGNIPTRYQPPADATTLATGDAGSRVACGVVEMSNGNDNGNTPVISGMPTAWPTRNPSGMMHPSMYPHPSGDRQGNH